MQLDVPIRRRLSAVVVIVSGLMAFSSTVVSRVAPPDQSSKFHRVPNPVPGLYLVQPAPGAIDAAGSITVLAAQLCTQYNAVLDAGGFAGATMFSVKSTEQVAVQMSNDPRVLGVSEVPYAPPPPQESEVKMAQVPVPGEYVVLLAPNQTGIPLPLEVYAAEVSGSHGATVIRLLQDDRYGFLMRATAEAAARAAKDPRVQLVAQNESGPTPEAYRRVFKAIPGQYLAILRTDVAGALGPSNRAVELSGALAARFGFAVARVLTHTLSGFDFNATAPQAVALSQAPEIAYVIEVPEAPPPPTIQSNPPWGLDRIDQRPNALSMSYFYNATGAGVHVYDLDTGIRATHIEFGGRVASGFDVWANTAGIPVDCDFGGHGTASASVTAGATFGVAKAATIHPVNMYRHCAVPSQPDLVSDFVFALEWVAVNHIKPAVVLFEGSTYPGGYVPLDVAARNTIQAGVTIVAAAHNLETDVAFVSPQRVLEVITVAAMLQSHSRASYSNYGALVDLYAPTDVGSAHNFNDSAIQVFRGTSAAAPHVAGTVALYLQDNPSATPASISAILTRMASLGVVENNVGATPNRLLYTGQPDGDGDSLPDWWEIQVGLLEYDPSGSQGAAGDPDGDGVSNASEFANRTHPRGNTRRYFAEGVTSSFFGTRISVANTTGSPAYAVLRYDLGSGATYSQDLVLPPTSSITVDPRSVAGMANAEFSTVIESDVAVVADRTITWDQSLYGSHSERAVAGPANQWFLAEGATMGGFDLFYLVQNPNAGASTIRVDFLLTSGAPVVKYYTISANSRFNIWVDVADAALGSAEVSGVVTVTGGGPVIVERAMYLSTANTFTAGHSSAGVTTPGTSWFFAEGATGSFFDEYLLIANPHPTQTATVAATFLRPDGQAPIIQYHYVPPQSRYNIFVDGADPALANTAVSTLLTSDTDIVAERSMWWPGPASTWYEAHNVIGATETGTIWAFAGGEVRPNVLSETALVETYILIANVSASPVTAQVQLLFEDGSTVTRPFAIPANSRFNVQVEGEFPESARHRFGAIVTSSAPVVCERATYLNRQGDPVWSAGHAALLTKVQ